MSRKPTQQTLLPWISSAADSPAKTSAMRGRARALPVPAPGSGSSMPESFASYDRASLSWRTSQRCLLGEWETFSESWPGSGMMRNGVVYGPVMLGLRIGESGCSLLPTPSVVQPEAMRNPRAGQTERPACDDNLAQSVSRFAPDLENPWPTPSAMDGSSAQMRNTPEIWREQSEKHAAHGQHKQYPLQVAAVLNASEGQAARMLWPTPCASDTMDAFSTRERDVHPASAHSLLPAVNGLRDGQLWPTPDASVFNMSESVEHFDARREAIREKRINGNGMGTPLAVEMKRWPTPQAHDAMGKPGKGTIERGGRQADLRVRLSSSGETGALSPAWVETLMGFPQGWTDIPPGWKPTKPTKPTPFPRTGPRAPVKPNTPGSPRAPRAKKKTAPPA